MIRNMVTFEQILKSEEIRTYIEEADKSLAAMGFTEHSFAHVGRVSRFAGDLLQDLGYDARTVELARIAGYMHDIGNVVNRIDHAQSGAIMAFRILKEMGMDDEGIAKVVTAIGNHDESTAFPVNEVAAAVILGDKTDVRRSRVRNRRPETFDIHDRVNYAVVEGKTYYIKEEKVFVHDIRIDTEISPVMDYFEIFIGRLMLCRKAADKLGISFRFIVNGSVLS